VHPRPSLIELRTGVINYAIRSTVDPAKLKNFADHELADRCTRACLGLTATYATEAVFRAISECAGLNDNTVAVIRRLKTDQIAKSRMLRIIPDEEIAAPEDLGGMDRVLADVRRMAKSYTDSADAIKLRVPRGIVLAGVAGTGKTRVATSCAAVIREESGLDFPVIEVDIGSGLGHLVGQSEHSSREAQSIIEALGGCVLLFDEAEKMFAGGQSGEGDSGVMRRVFSGWLKWMQSRALRGDRTFIVMSMNDPSGIPPEMFRRFDATYFVGMPNETVRERIFQIHFRREMALCGGVEALKLTPANWEYLIGQTHNFTGDEIEKIVQYSRSLRFQIDGGTVPTMEDLSAAIVAIGQTTIVKIHHEVIDRLVKWAEGRAIPSDDMASLDATFRQPVIARPASRRSAGRFPHSNN
jgi:SpoVK/Ycf46/Vps4 family AAA+-type ATPase